MKTCAELRANAVLSRLGEGKFSGAEIGVFRGSMSKEILKDDRIVSLYMVDFWKAMPRYKWSDADQQENMEEAIAKTDFANGRRVILRTDSENAAISFYPQSLDFVFIDADHSYEGCRKDIALWEPVVRTGGMLCGHDYDNPNEAFGKDVKRAVDEYANNVNKKIDLGDDHTWFIHL